eukprot:1156669-Pelagomonas_calceolata.AAC.4
MSTLQKHDRALWVATRVPCGPSFLCSGRSGATQRTKSITTTSSPTPQWITSGGYTAYNSTPSHSSSG